MVKILILSQGQLADVLLRACETISGSCGCLSALCLDWKDSIDSAEDKVRRALADLEAPEGVLILTDMVGGTPYNVAAGFCEPGQVELVAGVNLPMVLRLSCRDEDEGTVEGIAAWIEAKGRGSVRRHRRPVAGAAAGGRESG